MIRSSTRKLSPMCLIVWPSFIWHANWDTKFAVALIRAMLVKTISKTCLLRSSRKLNSKNPSRWLTWIHKMLVSSPKKQTNQAAVKLRPRTTCWWISFRLSLLNKPDKTKKATLTKTSSRSTKLWNLTRFLTSLKTWKIFWNLCRRSLRLKIRLLEGLCATRLCITSTSQSSSGLLQVAKSPRTKCQ